MPRYRAASQAVKDALSIVAVTVLTIVVITVAVMARRVAVIAVAPAVIAVMVMVVRATAEQQHGGEQRNTGDTWEHWLGP